MIEKTVLDHLNSQLSVDAFMETPETVPTSYVLIEKTAGGRDDFINRATLAIQSYAPTLYEAAVLNEAVKAAMWAITDTNDIFSCKLNSDYNYTDPETKQYRYQAVFDLVF